MEYIWQLIHLLPDENNSLTQEMIVGTFSREEYVLEVKKEMEKSNTHHIGEFDIHKHKIIR